MSEHLKNKKPITLWMVHIREDLPPEDAKPLEWFLLITGKTSSVEDAAGT